MLVVVFSFMREGMHILAFVWVCFVFAPRSLVALGFFFQAKRKGSGIVLVVSVCCIGWCEIASLDLCGLGYLTNR